MAAFSSSNFIDLLRRHRSVGPVALHTAAGWHVDVGDVLLAVNSGGETHTFTEVDEFGGGIVPLLNELAGFTDGCARVHPVEAWRFHPGRGMTTSETEEEEGVEKYQCCIHPWMRAESHVERSDGRESALGVLIVSCSRCRSASSSHCAIFSSFLP